MEKQDVVDDYLKAVEVSIERGGDTQFWPFGPGQVDSYFNDLLAINFFGKFRENPGKFKQALSLLSPNMIRWFLLPFTILGLKIAKKEQVYKAEPSEMVAFIETVWCVLKNKVPSDPFCLDEKSLILSEKEINKLSENLHLFDNTESKLGRHLSVDLESFVWAIDFDVFAYGVFWHGPYPFPNKRTLLVKRFLDLNPPFWNLNNLYSNVEIFFVFTSPIDVSIDFMSHLDYSEDIWDSLSSFAVQVNGNSLKNVNDIRWLSEHFSKLRGQQSKKVNNLTPTEIIQKGAEIYYYMFRSFFEYYDEDYAPPKELEDRLKKWGLKYWRKYKSQKTLKEQPIRDLTRRLYDPRIE